MKLVEKMFIQVRRELLNLLSAAIGIHLSRICQTSNWVLRVQEM